MLFSLSSNAERLTSNISESNGSEVLREVLRVKNTETADICDIEGNFDHAEGNFTTRRDFG